MISLQILDTKRFMSKLLLSDTFDHFYITEATITTFNTFIIDGHLQKDYYSTEELENINLAERSFSYWSQVKPFCLELMKGTHTPVNFKIVFQLSAHNTEQFLKQTNSNFTPADISGFYLNLRYSGQQLNCITGTSFHLFTLDKSLDHAWDDMICKFLKQQELSFIE